MKFTLRHLSIMTIVFGMALLVVIFLVTMDKGGLFFPCVGNSATDSGRQQGSEMFRSKWNMLSTSFNGEEDHDQSRQLRFELERDGAWAEVRCRVSDRFGDPVPDAEIRLFFDVKEGKTESGGIVEGKTDREGRFSAKHKTTYACHWRIRKDGYYETRGILPFSNHFSLEQGLKGRWTAEPLPLDVVLDEKSGTTLIHGKIYWKHLAFPTNTVVWFDFETGDCVEPYGKGKNKDICIYSEGLADPRIGFRSGIAWTNLFVVASPEGGVALLKEKKDSTMPFVHEAPEEFEIQKLEFTYARSHDRIYVDTKPKAGDYLVFRTSCDGSGERKPHYGVIRDIECWPGGLRMEWFFNKTPGDRRIDGDICAPRTIDR